MQAKPSPMLVRPREPDMVIRDPRSRIKLPPYGGKVPRTIYWVRRLNCKDVVTTTQAAIDKGRAEEKAKAEAAAKTEAKSSEQKQKPSGKGGR